MYSSVRWAWTSLARFHGPGRRHLVLVEQGEVSGEPTPGFRDLVTDVALVAAIHVRLCVPLQIFLAGHHLATVAAAIATILKSDNHRFQR